MLGSEGAIARVLHRLEQGLPTALNSIRTRHGIDVADLADIRQYLDHEPDQIGVDQTPTVYVVEGPTRAQQGGRRVAAGPLADGWSFTYVIRVFCVVRGDSYRDTQLRCRRTTLAVRETLIGVLDYPAAPTEPDDDDNSFLEIRPVTLQEDYSEVGQDRSGRSMRSSYVQAEFASQEWITAYPPPTGQTVQAFNTGVGNLGP